VRTFAKLDDARDAEPAVAERLDDLGSALHEVRGDLAVLGRALREPETLDAGT
jgi:hypothetical protein